jgi:hypothetical protein
MSTSPEDDDRDQTARINALKRQAEQAAGDTDGRVGVGCGPA